jgi:hypothetical protein
MFQDNVSVPSSRILDCFIHEDGSDALLEIVDNELPTYAAHLQKSEDFVSDFVKADETTVTMATMTIGELHVSVKSGMVKKVMAVMKRQMRSPQFLHLLKQS